MQNNSTIYLRSLSGRPDGHLTRFIRTFRPERLLPGKDYWLHLEADGRFSVRLGKTGEELPHLSETENLVYRYLCLVQLLRFWEQTGQLPKETCVGLRDFSHRLEEGTDPGQLYARGGGRVFVFLDIS